MSSAPVVFIDAVGREVFVDRKRVVEDGRRVWRYGVYTRLAPRVVAKVGGIPLVPQRRDAISLLKAHAQPLGWQPRGN